MRSPAACSARTTRSRTDAIASRRSTAVSTGRHSCARRSPSPASTSSAGEYLLAVNGRDLRATDQSVQRLREHRREDRRDHRRPERRTAPARARCRSCQWRTSRRCGSATGWRAICAWSTKPPTAASPTSTCPTPPTLGHAYFKRYFFPQAHKDAIIVDERFNGGGQVADYYIDILRRPLRQPLGDALRRRSEDPDRVDPGTQGDDRRRDRRLRRRPPAVDVPQVQARPDRRQRGPGAASLASSASRSSWTAAAITAPNLAIWTEDGWVVENEGVPPDVEVEQTPADVIDGPRSAAREGHRAGARRAEEERAGRGQAATLQEGNRRLSPTPHGFL